LTLRDLADASRITATEYMASSAAIVHQILYAQPVQCPSGSPDGVQSQTRILRAILRMSHGVELAWARVTRHRG
jgi:hypothetical protein